MNNCLHCNNPTINPKFCNLSCAAKFNNKKFPRKEKSGKCKHCGAVIKLTRVYCNKCYELYVTANKFDFIIATTGYFYPENNGGNPGSKAVRKYLIKKHGNICSLCHLDANDWCGVPLVLIVDHIDGHANNWKVDNIRLICPNCDTQLPTFKGRNKGNSTRKYTITQR